MLFFLFGSVFTNRSKASFLVQINICLSENCRYLSCTSAISSSLEPWSWTTAGGQQCYYRLAWNNRTNALRPLSRSQGCLPRKKSRKPAPTPSPSVARRRVCSRTWYRWELWCGCREKQKDGRTKHSKYFRTEGPSIWLWLWVLGFWGTCEWAYRSARSRRLWGSAAEGPVWCSSCVYIWVPCLDVGVKRVDFVVLPFGQRRHLELDFLRMAVLRLLFLDFCHEKLLLLQLLFRRKAVLNALLLLFFRSGL